MPTHGLAEVPCCFLCPNTHMVTAPFIFIWLDTKPPLHGCPHSTCIHFKTFHFKFAIDWLSMPLWLLIKIRVLDVKAEKCVGSKII